MSGRLLRGIGQARTSDPQRLRRAGKQFDALKKRIPTVRELEEKGLAMETQIQDNATTIAQITAALKKAGIQL